jgi:hypothetical protein
MWSLFSVRFRNPSRFVIDDLHHRAFVISPPAR